MFSASQFIRTVSEAGLSWLKVRALPAVGWLVSVGPLPPGTTLPSCTHRKGAALLKLGDVTSGLVVNDSRKAGAAQRAPLSSRTATRNSCRGFMLLMFTVLAQTACRQHGSQQKEGHIVAVNAQQRHVQWPLLWSRSAHAYCQFSLPQCHNCRAHQL